MMVTAVNCPDWCSQQAPPPAVSTGDRVAQLVLERIHTPSVVEVEVCGWVGVSVLCVV